MDILLVSRKNGPIEQSGKGKGVQFGIGVRKCTHMHVTSGSRRPRLCVFIVKSYRINSAPSLSSAIQVIWNCACRSTYVFGYVDNNSNGLVDLPSYSVFILGWET